MPAENKRPHAAARANAELPTSGRMTVTYVGQRKRTSDATIIGVGTNANTLKLTVHDTDSNRVVDNVPPQTALNQTNVYISRRRV